MGLDARKIVVWGLRTTKAQTSLRGSVWSAPLLFACLKVLYLDLLRANFKFIASLCSWEDRFGSWFVRNPKTGFVALWPVWANSLCAFLSFIDCFQNQVLPNILSGIPTECQLQSTESRSGWIFGPARSGYNCLQSYQQMTLVGKE